MESTSISRVFLVIPFFESWNLCFSTVDVKMALRVSTSYCVSCNTSIAYLILTLTAALFEAQDGIREPNSAVPRCSIIILRCLLRNPLTQLEDSFLAGYFLNSVIRPLAVPDLGDGSPQLSAIDGHMCACALKIPLHP